MKRYRSFVAALGMCFFASNTTAHAQVRADTGSIAIGGSVTGSTVIIGIPQEKVDELVRDAKRPLEELTTQQRENIVLLKEKLDLNERQVRAALGILGENDIPPERLAAKLVEIAQRFKELQTTASAQPGDDPKIAALKTDAQKAIEAGQLAQADALLADVETDQRRALDRFAVNAAETSARRGEIALTRLRYAEAAKHFANAAAVFPPKSAHEDKRIGYLGREAAALSLQGDEFGDNSALGSAIERRKQLVELTPYERDPLEWANAQNNLGNALRSLGFRESGTTRLQEAAAAFRKALKEWTRERVPEPWAAAHNNLGGTLLALGQRETGTAKLEEAVVAFREALKEFTRESKPDLWATTQSNLGITLVELGQRETGTARLEEAVVAFRQALEIHTRKRAPLFWAKEQSNLGTALSNLGQRESGTAKLEEAVVAYREALKEQTRERVPLDWAATQVDLGAALGVLGGRETGTAKLEEAVVAFREALKELTRERIPLTWALTQANMGVALVELGNRETGTAKLEEAVVAFREALKEQTRERAPQTWASTFGAEGTALMLLAERRRDVVMAKNALSQINTAFELLRNGGDARAASDYEQRLTTARALVARLGKARSAR
jgi:tetratricopeptide (TPR) repeat protein